jgi:hypothetical protein
MHTVEELRVLGPKPGSEDDVRAVLWGSRLRSKVSIEQDQ